MPDGNVLAEIVEGGVRLRVKLCPKAARDRIDGVMDDAEGRAVLKVSVTAVPEDGKANAALIKLLAKRCKLPKTAFTIVSGATDRRKLLHIAGDAQTLLVQLQKGIAPS